MKVSMSEVKPVRKVARRKSVHYINNRDFWDAFVAHRANEERCKEAGLPPPELPRYIGEAFMQICNKLGFKFNFINYCVDEETEALTQRGWLRYDEIDTDDLILSYDQASQRLTWSRVKSIYRNDYDGMMHKLDVKGLDAFVTPNHKFVTKRGIVPIEEISTSDQIVLTGKPVKDDYLSYEVYDDSFVELVGWAVTEGYYKVRDGVRKTSYSIDISQNIGLKANRIRNALIDWYENHPRSNDESGRWSSSNDFAEYAYPEKLKCMSFRVTGELARKIMEISPNRVMTMEFILALSQRQRELLIRTMVDADGCTNHKTGGRGYSQKCEKHADMFQLLCVISGLTVSHVRAPYKNCFSEGVGSTVRIFAEPKYTCDVQNIDFHGGKPTYRGSKSIGKPKSERPNIPTAYYRGVVWCPETEYGSWVCRRRKYTYITGNSYRDEMIGDAIENCVAAAHNFDPNKSTNPFSYFTMVAWNAFIRRIGREKKQAYIKYKNINNGLLNDLLVELQNGDDSHRNRHNTQVFNDSMSKVVESFESKLKLTKIKKKSNVGIEKFLDGDQPTPPAYADGPRVSTNADMFKGK